MTETETVAAADADAETAVPSSFSSQKPPSLSSAPRRSSATSGTTATHV